MRMWVLILAALNVLLFGWIVLQKTQVQPEGGAPSPVLEFNNLSVQRPDSPEAGQAVLASEQCIRARGFDDVAKARSRLVLPDGFGLRVVTEAVETDPLWWVHLPPTEGADKARARLAALQERGIDSFLVAEGDFKNAISFGYFRNRDNAVRLRDEYTTARIDARLEKLPRSENVDGLVAGPLDAGEAETFRTRAAEQGWSTETIECR